MRTYISTEFTIAAIALFFIIYVYSYFVKRKTERQSAKNLQKFLNEATKLTIDLTKITVKGRSFQTEIIEEQHTIEEHLFDDNSTFIREFDSTFTFSVHISDTKHTYTLKLPYEDTWLRTHFYIKKTTDIYISSFDKEYACVDFRFLDKPDVDYVFVFGTNFKEY